MVKCSRDENGDKIPIQLTFKITIYKEQFIAGPGGKQHECTIHCHPGSTEVIEIKPLELYKSFNPKKPGKSVSTWTERRALLSMILGFADAQFHSEVAVLAREEE